MNCLIILLLLCCCGNSNNHVCCDHSHNCEEKCNERREPDCEEVYSDRSYDRSCDKDNLDDRKNDCRHDFDSCDDYDRDRRDNAWKDYSDFRRNDSCDCN